MSGFDFYLRIKSYSISINTELVEVLKWQKNWDTATLFRWQFKKEKPKPKPEPKPIQNINDDEIDPIPF